MPMAMPMAISDYSTMSMPHNSNVNVSHVSNMPTMHDPPMMHMTMDWILPSKNGRGLNMSFRFFMHMRMRLPYCILMSMFLRNLFLVVGVDVVDRHVDVFFMQMVVVVVFFLQVDIIQMYFMQVVLV
jgi:hypothetical protein